jgi:hypothetical protein
MPFLVENQLAPCLTSIRISFDFQITLDFSSCQPSGRLNRPDPLGIEVFIRSKAPLHWLFLTLSAAATLSPYQPAG